MELQAKINHWTNKNVIFITDYQAWGVRDYWQTPRETLNLLTGDCEDYAIFKYFTLVNRGIDPSDLQVWYGYHYQIPHMVVTYCGMVLDSNTNDILPLTQSTFQPRFRIDSPNITRWTNLQHRIK